jgi:hypothetical protein
MQTLYKEAGWSQFLRPITDAIWGLGKRVGKSLVSKAGPGVERAAKGLYHSTGHLYDEMWKKLFPNISTQTGRLVGKAGLLAGTAYTANKALHNNSNGFTL